MEFFEGLFTLHSFFTLLMLILLQAVLGFDNLLYISIESKRVEESQQARVRRIGIVLAIALRIVLLFTVQGMISLFEDPFLVFGVDHSSVGEDGHLYAKPTNTWLAFAFNLESVVVLLGGAFILYTAVKEILHMVSTHDLEHGAEKQTRSFNSAVFWIVLMNLVFSFDSILSAMALTDVFPVMATAIIIGGILMIWLSEKVSAFLQKNRMYEVLGLFVLFVVGIMLLTEGAHLAHLHIFENPITPMSKTTFYFIILILVIVDIVQGRYQKKIVMEESRAGSSQA